MKGPAGRVSAAVLRLTLAALLLPWPARAGSFVFADETSGIDLVAHPQGYSGGGGPLVVTLCVDPDSFRAADLETPLQNIAAVFNALQPRTGNLVSGGANAIGPSEFDLESVALHEVGHCLGLNHPNLGIESGLIGVETDATRTTDGPDNIFDVASGPDGIHGSEDDPRGDDHNLHWFRKSDNNPFTLASTVDATTYSRDLADLPAGHSFAANGSRSVASLLGVPGTEAVMQQGTPPDEAQRDLTHDDVGTLLYAMSGIDEQAGTPDDYSLFLDYVGQSASCDIRVGFDDSRTSFAVCETTAFFIGPFSARHVQLNSARISFNSLISWFFNSVPLDPDGDGLSTETELALGTDPAEADSDGDGLSDGEEDRVFGTDPLDYDSDGDGAGDGDEVAAGTDPTDPESVPDTARVPVAPPGTLGGAAALLLAAGLGLLRRRSRGSR